MRKPISLLLVGLTPFLITLGTSCASLGLLSPPELLNRTLRFSLDRPALEYQYWTCVKRFLGFCTRQEIKKDTYDLSDEKVRRQLIDMGFVAHVRDQQ